MHKALLLSVLIPALAATALAGDSLRFYGDSTPGTGGRAPSLWASTTPRPGAAGFALLIEDGPPSAVAIPAWSLRQASVQVGGLTLLLDPGALLLFPALVLSGQGEGAVPLPIPADPQLKGATLYCQTFVLDPAGPGGLSATRGLRVRVARPPLLLVPRSVGGSPDPQMAVDLATAAIVDFGAGQVDNGQSVAFSRDRSHAFVAGTLSCNVAIYDVTSFPPRYVTSYATRGQGRPYFVTITPDGLRGYVVHQSSAGLNPEVEVFYALVGTPLLGTPFPGPTVPLGGVIDAMNMVFQPDGNTGYIGTLGFVSTPARILKVDTRVASPTYNQVQATITFPGLNLWAIDISPDGDFLYASVGPFSGPAEIAVVSTATFTVVDMDPGTPGVQNIGGERSIPRTPIENMVTNVKACPRGRHLYLANFHSVSRLVIDMAHPTFRQILTDGTGLSGTYTNGLALSGAGDLLYVGLHSGSRVVEMDARTLRQLRSFPVGNNPTRIAVR